MFTRMYGLLQLEQHYLVNKKGSFYERSIWPIANLIKILNGRKYSIFCCKFSYPCLLICRKFLILALRHHAFSIVVSTTDFISSLIASICEDGMVCIKNQLELEKTASLLPRLLSSFTCWSTLKYFNSTTLLTPKVNITRVKFSRMTIDS